MPCPYCFVGTTLAEMSKQQSTQQLSAGAMPRWLYLCRRGVRFLLRSLVSLDIQGEDSFPDAPPYIFVVNHLSWLDVVVMFALLHHKTAVFAAEKWEHHPVGGPIMRWFGYAIFVQRGEVDRQALKQALNWLRSGNVLGLAPEGTRSPTHALQRGKEGVAYLAHLADVPILPAVAWGQETAVSDWLHLRLPVIHVRVGQPFRLPRVPVVKGANRLASDTEIIMLALARLLPPAYRGVYAGPLSRTSPVSEGDSGKDEHGYRA